MTPKSFLLTEAVSDYLIEHNPPLDIVLRSLVAETTSLGPIASMQIAPEQGAFMTWLARSAGARFAVEVGTFTGYSSICIARGLAPEGRLLCCDVNAEWTAIARRYWELADLEAAIELRLAPALETLRALPAEPAVDLAFIDADKPGYVDYYEELLPRLSDGGVIVVDNVLWSGRVADASDNDADTVALRRFNDHVSRDARADAVMLPLADGLTLIRRRA